MRKLTGLAVLLTVCAFGEQLRIDFDPVKTTISWTLTGNVHTVHGTFRLKQGHVVVDTASGAASGELDAAAVSGESGNGTRDRRMRKEVLESERFPEIRLLPRRISGTVVSDGKSVVEVEGSIVIHGAEHAVTIPMTVLRKGREVTATGKFAVPFVDWGMKDPSNFLFKVDQSVDLEIVGIGTVAPK